MLNSSDVGYCVGWCCTNLCHTEKRKTKPITKVNSFLQFTSCNQNPVHSHFSVTKDLAKTIKIWIFKPQAFIVFPSNSLINTKFRTPNKNPIYFSLLSHQKLDKIKQLKSLNIQFSLQFLRNQTKTRNKNLKQIWKNNSKAPHLLTYEARWFCQHYQGPRTRSWLLFATNQVMPAPHKTNQPKTLFFEKENF